MTAPGSGEQITAEMADRIATEGQRCTRCSAEWVKDTERHMRRHAAKDSRDELRELLLAALPESLGPISFRRPAVPLLNVEASTTGYGDLLVDVLLPVVEAYATRKAAEELRAALAAVQAVYDLQCPVMPSDHYVGAGAHIAHKWWEKVLGHRLNDLRARADALTATPNHGKATT